MTTFDITRRIPTVSAGACHSPISVERRVDTVILRQGDSVIQLDEWYTKSLREGIFDVAPRTKGPAFPSVIEPLTYPPFSESGRPFDTNAVYCTSNEWSTGTESGSGIRGYRVIARPFQSRGTPVPHPLHGQVFPTHDAARQALYEADLTVEFISRHLREATQ